jgi:hypothetical protein
MKRIPALLIALLSATFAQVSHAGEIRATYGDVVAPDPDLRKVLRDLRRVAAAGSERDIAKVEAYFAVGTKTFSRGLDPFEPWRPGPKLTSNYLEGVANVMVEQGEFAAGLPVPDYRLTAMTLIASLISDDATFGALPEFPGATCAPAVYKVDRKEVRAFARRFDLDAHSLYFFPDEIFLAKAPGGKRGERVPANTLMISNYDPGTPDGWTRAETAGGVKGYFKDRENSLGLSQSHVCFAKVKGRYRITGILGYGL